MLDDKEKELGGGLHDQSASESEYQESPSLTPQAEEPAPENPVMQLPEIPPPGAEVAPPAALEPVSETAARRSGSGWKLFAAALALVAFGAGIGSTTTWVLSSQLQAGIPVGYEWAQSAAAKQVSDVTPEANIIPSIYRKLGPSVVKIDVRTQSGWSSGAGSGSGFVVDSRGYILTNHHVVNNANLIRVKFIDGTVLEGKLVGTDKYKDLAVIQVDPGDRSLIAAPLGDSDHVQVGELAIAIGSPFGQEFTVTSGIISALNREIIGEDPSNPFGIKGSIQTDAAINPGNSGGPLINSRGEVIGINTAIDGPVRGNVGIGFAVPINAAKQILPAMIAGEKVQYAFLGVTMNDMTPEYARALGVDVTQGAMIREAHPSTPAGQAGLRSAGVNLQNQLVSADIVVEIDGQPIRSSQDLSDYVARKRVGDTITLTVVRGKERLTLTATLGDREALYSSTNN